MPAATPNEPDNPPPDKIETKEIIFPDGSKATAVFPTVKSQADDIVRKLEIPSYNAVLLLIGGADSIPPNLLAQMTGLFNMGIGHAIEDTHAIVIDGGTKAGVMELIGNMGVSLDNPPPMIGVAPRGAVSLPDGPQDRTPLEPHHNKFVLPEGNDFGDETKTLFNLFAALCKPRPTSQPGEVAAKGIPGIVILAGGKDISKKELLHAVRGKYPVIVIEGSGGLADTIAAAWEEFDKKTPTDPEIAQILDEGNLQFHALSNPVKGITRLIIRLLERDRVLLQAWQTFGSYDRSAGEMQKKANHFQIWIIFLGFLATSLAVIHQVYPPKALTAAAVATIKDTAVKTAKDTTVKAIKDTATQHPPVKVISPGPGTVPTFLATGYFWFDSLTIILILMPIFLTMLLTAQSRFKPAAKWLLLRAAAELIKQEIYRYRLRIRHYGNTAQSDLAKRLTDIMTNAMSTDINNMALTNYPDDLPLPPGMDAAKGGDDGFTMLTPEQYIEIRIGDQIRYFRKKIPKLQKQYASLTWMILIISGAATLLSALNQSVWLAVTTAAITALGTYLSYRQTDATRIKYNQTNTNLEGIKSWWNGLSHEEQCDQANIDMLVDHTEQTLQSEMDGWVQQMRNVLDRLTKEIPASAPGPKDAQADNQKKP
jgi:hypothetical protein